MNILLRQKIQTGFSLVEILLYISLIAVIGVSVSQSANGVLSSKLRKEVRATVRQEADYISKVLVENTLLADSINTPVSGSDTTLSLASTVSSLNPTVFTLSGGNLTLSKGGGSALQVNSDKVIVEEFKITNYTGASGPGNIEIEFTVTFDNVLDNIETTYSESFKTNVSIRR